MVVSFVRFVRTKQHEMDDGRGVDYVPFRRIELCRQNVLTQSMQRGRSEIKPSFEQASPYLTWRASSQARSKTSWVVPRNPLDISQYLNCHHRGWPPRIERLCTLYLVREPFYEPEPPRRGFFLAAPFHEGAGCLRKPLSPG